MAIDSKAKSAVSKFFKEKSAEVRSALLVCEDSYRKKSVELEILKLAFSKQAPNVSYFDAATLSK